jgi:uncharacterized membrane protein
MHHFGRIIKGSIIAGLAILIPVVTSIYIIVQAFLWIDGLLPAMVQTELPPGIGVAAILFITLFTGLIAKNYLGKRIIKLSTGLICHVPILNKVYITLQQIMDLLVNQKKNFTGRPVLVEYPRPNSWALGFVTTSETQEISEAAGQKLICVYIPTTPNPTSGFMLYVPAEAVKEVKMSPEIAMKAVISAGIVSSAQTDSRHTDTPLPELVEQWLKQSSKKGKPIVDPRD